MPLSAHMSSLSSSLRPRALLAAPLLAPPPVLSSPRTPPPLRPRPPPNPPTPPPPTPPCPRVRIPAALRLGGTDARSDRRTTGGATTKRRLAGTQLDGSHPPKRYPVQGEYDLDADPDAPRPPSAGTDASATSIGASSDEAPSVVTQPSPSKGSGPGRLPVGTGRNVPALPPPRLHPSFVVPPLPPRRSPPPEGPPPGVPPQNPSASVSAAASAAPDALSTPLAFDPARAAGFPRKPWLLRGEDSPPDLGPWLSGDALGPSVYDVLPEADDRSWFEPGPDDGRRWSSDADPVEAHDVGDDSAVDWSRLRAAAEAAGLPGPAARARRFDNHGRFQWAPCWIVEGSVPPARGPTDLLTIRMVDANGAGADAKRPGLVRRVRRLNLALDGIDLPGPFSARLRAARRGREEAAQRVALESYLNRVAFDLPAFPDARWERRVLARACGGAGPALAERHPDTVDAVQDEVRASFEEAAKTAVLQSKMATQHGSAELEAEGVLACLPPLRPAPAPPLAGQALRGDPVAAAAPEGRALWSYGGTRQEPSRHHHYVDGTSPGEDEDDKLLGPDGDASLGLAALPGANAGTADAWGVASAPLLVRGYGDALAAVLVTLPHARAPYLACLHLLHGRLDASTTRVVDIDLEALPRGRLTVADVAADDADLRAAAAARGVEGDGGPEASGSQAAPSPGVKAPAASTATKTGKIRQGKTRKGTRRQTTPNPHTDRPRLPLPLDALCRHLVDGAAVRAAALASEWAPGVVAALVEAASAAGVVPNTGQTARAGGATLGRGGGGDTSLRQEMSFDAADPGGPSGEASGNSMFAPGPGLTQVHHRYPAHFRRFAQSVSLTMTAELARCRDASAAQLAAVLAAYDCSPETALQRPRLGGRWGAGLYSAPPPQLLLVTLRFDDAAPATSPGADNEGGNSTTATPAREGRVSLEPSPGEVLARLTETFESVVSSCDGVEDLPAALVQGTLVGGRMVAGGGGRPLLPPPRPDANPEAEPRGAAVAAARRAVLAALDSGFVGPRALVESLSTDLSELIALEERAWLRTWAEQPSEAEREAEDMLPPEAAPGTSSRDAAVSQTELDPAVAAAIAARAARRDDPIGDGRGGASVKAALDEAARFRDLSRRALASTEAVVTFPLVAVECAGARDALSAKALRLRSGVLDDLAARWATRTANLQIELDAKAARLRREPQTPEELEELQKQLDNAEELLPTWMERLEESRETRGLLETEHHAVSDPAEAGFWRLLGAPSRLAEAQVAARRTVAAARGRFLEELKSARETLAEDLLVTEGDVVAFSQLGDLSAVEERATSALVLRERLDALRARCSLCASREGIFGLAITPWPVLDRVVKQFGPSEQLWQLGLSLSQELPEWRDGPLHELDAEAIAARVDESRRAAGKLTKAMPEGSAALAAVLEARKALEDFADRLPLATALCSRGMQPRHWQQVSALCGHEVRPGDDLTLEGAVRLGLGDHLAALQDIAEQATKEHSLERALRKMESEWSGVALDFAPWRDTGTFRLRGTDDVQALLDDHSVKTQAMRASPYIGALEGAVALWEAQLTTAQDTIDAWLKCQEGWTYLEPIFGSDDIMQQMPAEGAKFRSVDATWREVMAKSVKIREVMLLTSDPYVGEALDGANALLDDVTRGLNDYLETKRVAFPRFYFLADPELLAILSETKDPTRVQPYMAKCFEGIMSLEFDGNLIVRAMISAEGERVPVRPFEPALAGGAVEKWLIECEAAMKAAVKLQLLESTADRASTPRASWVLKWPGQVVLGVDQVFWTTETSLAIDGGTLPEHETKLTAELMEVVEKVRGDLAPLERSTMSALITLSVHGRDVVADLAAKGVSSETEFEWISQLRYGWEEADGTAGGPGPNQAKSDLTVRMINARLTYGYEYLGNSARLVITPLTDRCYRTLMGALHLNFGGAPEGPAGTGKTETTKDLAKALAQQCVVFNCSDQMDYLAMGKMFKGLASAGAWACFDEFNRIDLEVLSVIAQQILTIQRAKALGRRLFEFEGSRITLKPSCNVFITMNPGYAGRSELPDNLKALFRTVAMMVPDYAMISEIILYGAGYEEARELARKLVATYRLCSEQLSSQKHYDYGMRAVISVLRAAAANKRKASLNSLTESALMLRSITDVNLPKFLAPDVPLFHGILSDLFPGTEVPETDTGSLQRRLEEECAATNLQPVPIFLEKVFQLYEMMLVRHGLMIVGKSFGGKTAMLNSLAGALKRMEENKEGTPGVKVEHKAVIRTMNPKSVYIDALYGAVDRASKEWKDGVLAVQFREAYKAGVGEDASSDRQWLVLDGPVDAVWIENMNTVLDDNKKLCLNSGETISMTDRMNMVFEVQDLLQASPATVSRCGMVFCEPGTLTWSPLADSWLAALDGTRLEPHRERLRTLLSWFLGPTIAFVRRNCTEMVETADVPLVSSTLHVFDSLASECGLRPIALSGHVVEQGAPPKTYKVDGQGERELARHVDGLFLLALTWGIGGAVTGPSRAPFGDFIRALCVGEVDPAIDRRVAKEVDDGGPPVFDLGPGVPVLYPEDDRTKAKLACPPLPRDGTAHDHVYDAGRGAWRPWLDLAPHANEPLDAKADFSSLIVPTHDTARYSFLFDSLVLGGRSALLVGPTGTGKTVYAQSRLDALDTLRWANIQTGFSARTRATAVVDTVGGKLKSRRSRTGPILSPGPGLRCVVFVDDVNMPALETYGAQPPVELLRQILCQGGWWGREDNQFNTLQNVQIAAAMGPPGGGRNEVSPRFLRHFNVIAVAEFDDVTLSRIYGAVTDWWIRRSHAAEGVAAKAGALVRSSVDLYKSVRRELLPTPAKSHYVYNMRDLSKIFQGMAMHGGGGAAPDDAPGVARLWAHEATRVFADRLTTERDRRWLRAQVVEAVRAGFGVDPSVAFGVPAGSTPARAPEAKAGVDPHGDEFREPPASVALSLLNFAHFSHPEKEEQVYEVVEDLASLIEVVNTHLEAYNAEHAVQMNLVLFGYAIEHVCRISRVLRQPQGHCLLVGVGGSGRQSLTRVAAWMAEMNVMSIEPSKSYGQNEWREDLMRILDHAGGQGKQTVFVLADTQLSEEAFLEDINTLLNTGEVPNLFPRDEAAILSEKVAKRLKKEGRPAPDGAEAIWAAFVSECRRCLHVSLCLSPVGDAFRARLRAFPSLVSCCAIDWFSEWPRDGLQAVAKAQLLPVDFDTDEVRAAVEETCCAMHISVREMAEKFRRDMGRPYYTTPTSYLELIGTYKRILHEKRDVVTRQQTRYEGGLSKVRAAERDVGTMKQELIALGPKLEETSKQVAETLKVVESETAAAQTTKDLVAQDEAIASQKAAAASAIKADCESELAQALPALNKALREVDKLKPADIQFVKAMRNPPIPVKTVMEAVCLLFGSKPVKIPDPDNAGKKIDSYWPASMQLLGQMDFVQQLKAFDKDGRLNEKLIVLIETYLDRPEFADEAVKKASSAAYGIAQWVRAMKTYFYVARDVAPKRAKLAEAETELKEVMDSLAVKKGELRQVENKIKGLNDKLDAARAQLKGLEDEAALCEVKLTRAGQLISGLGGEKVRWGEVCQQLGRDLENLAGDALLGAGYVAYLGAFTAEYRSEALAQWETGTRERGIPCSEKFSLQKTLGDEIAIRQWVLQGLPNDALSIENSVIMANARRWPLCIDPQNQANSWIRAREAANRLHVVKLTDKSFMRTLENCLPLGFPVLIENVGEELDPSLEPLLLRQTRKEGGAEVIRLGDRNIEYATGFRLYITTKLRNPHYLPEVAVKVTLLNFMITPAGLEDQLLGLVVARERPDLQEAKEVLVRQGAATVKQLREIEDRIIEVLSSSEGNILEDEAAIDAISGAKITSDAAAKAGAEARKTEARIDQSRSGFAPVARHAAACFFCVSDMSFVEPMYQYSLSWFIAIFEGSVRDAPSPGGRNEAAALAARLGALVDHFTYAVYASVCRSLFEKDKPLFGFLLSATLEMKLKGTVDPAHFRFLLTGGLSTADPPPNPTSGWLPSLQWAETTRLAAIAGGAFAGLEDDVAGHEDLFRAWYDAEKPLDEALPCGWDNKLDAFQRLLVVRVLRPDLLTNASFRYVNERMGQRFTEPPPVVLDDCLADSTTTTPLIFVLSPGVDPMTPILKLAERQATRVESISLGQGQGPAAEQLIAAARAGGFWVVLQNCHLASSWMPTLERLVEGIAADEAAAKAGGKAPSDKGDGDGDDNDEDEVPGGTDPRFRLWLTSYPSESFPVAVLQSGIKMTSDPPKGLRANLLGSLAADPVSDPAFFGGCERPREFRRLLYSLCFFHAVVQERLQFGPIGWNVPYQFSQPDFVISARQLRMFLDESVVAGGAAGGEDEVLPLPLPALLYLTGECNYGGRVTDAKDRRTLASLLSVCYNTVVAAGTAEGAKPYQYSPSGLYVAPPDDAIDSLNALETFVRSLPTHAAPEVFGLHSNADISKDAQEASAFTDALLKTQRGSGGGGGGSSGSSSAQSREEVLDALAADILARLPPDFDLLVAQHRYPVDYHESMNTVLTQELVRFNGLTSTVRRQLGDLRRALIGEVVMDGALEAVAEAMYDGKVPAAWMAVSYPSVKPLAGYVKDLVKRLQGLAAWVEGGPPDVFWLSGFFFTHAFLTGVKQNHARKEKVPIDTVNWSFVCLPEGADAPGRPEPGQGAHVEGLFLDGARWDADSKLLAEQRPKELTSAAPRLWLRPRAGEPDQGPYYECPLYVEPRRRGVLQTTGHSSNYVLDIQLPSDRDQDHWIRRGVCCLLSLAD